MNDRTISVVIPTIGRVSFLDLAIDSALEQNSEPDEIIVYDNSKDQNLKELSKHNLETKINWFKSGGGLGAIESWNNAVLCGKSKYITIIGDDDLLEKNYIDQVEKLLKCSKVGVLRARVIDERGKDVSDLPYPSASRFTDVQFRLHRIKNQLSLFVPGIVFSKDDFLKVGKFIDTGLDGYAFSDEYLLFRLSALHNNIALSNEVCWKYRTHSDQIGGVRSLGSYIERADQYVIRLDYSLRQILADNGNNFGKGSFSVRTYMDQVARYGVLNFARSKIRLSQYRCLVVQILSHYLLDGRVSWMSKIITLATIIRMSFASTTLGMFLKKALRNS